MVEEGASGGVVAMMTFARVLCDWMVTWIGDVGIIPQPRLAVTSSHANRLRSKCTAFTHTQCSRLDACTRAAWFVSVS